MSKTSKLTHASRVIKILEMLHAKCFVTVPELMEYFNVSRRTVYNDLRALKEADVPLFSEHHPPDEARWALKSEAKKQILTLGAGQVMPMGLSLLALSFLKGTEISEQLETIMQKLSMGASSKTKEHLAELPRKISMVPHGPKLYKRKAEVIDDILSGLLYNQCVSFIYQSPGSKTKRKHIVEPLTLTLYREALYLTAYSRSCEKTLLFAVDRIFQSKRLKNEAFSYPKDYSPSDVLGDAFGLFGGKPVDVEIIFDAKQAPYIRERHWHKTQKFKALPDGRLRMKVRVAGTFDVLRWLLGHTGTFEVVAPDSLRDEVLQAMQKGIAQNKKKS